MGMQAGQGVPLKGEYQSRAKLLQVGSRATIRTTANILPDLKINSCEVILSTLNMGFIRYWSSPDFNVSFWHHGLYLPLSLSKWQ